MNDLMVPILVEYTAGLDEGNILRFWTPLIFREWEDKGPDEKNYINFRVSLPFVATVTGMKVDLKGTEWRRNQLPTRLVPKDRMDVMHPFPDWLQRYVERLGRLPSPEVLGWFTSDIGKLEECESGSLV